MLVTKGRGWDGKLRNQLQTPAPHSCYILPRPGTGPPATIAEIQNPYLLYVLLLEVSLSLTSLKCFWLEAAEDTGLLLTQILSILFVDLACTVTQNIDVKA